MVAHTGDLNAVWGRLLVEELIRHKACRFFISPGSRSTPLTSAVAISKAATATLCLDERAAAFQALGFARASGKPVVLICSSGTAGANYFPALIEASVDQIPMIVLTADRPPELRETSANQTIQQMPLYGNYTRWQFDLPCPSLAISNEFVLTTVAQLVAKSQFPTPGPVHLNCMFREPFTVSDNGAVANELKCYLARTSPYTKIYTPITKPAKTQLREFSELISSKNGVLSVGRLKSAHEQAAVEELAEALNWPIVPDICSGLRLGTASRAKMLPYFDQMLLSKRIAEMKVDVILQIGAPPVSKRWHAFAKTSNATKICVQSSFDRQDPDHQTAHRFMGSIIETCKSLARAVNRRAEHLEFDELTRQIDSEISSVAADDEPINEIAVARIVSEEIQEEHALFLAASMPIRDMNMYAAFANKHIPCSANRGASGIDGTIASACGYAEGMNRQTTLVIGDLASLHDLNSLHLLNDNIPPITIVVVNNGGGGIFSFLPIASDKEVFNPWFSTPHEIEFKKAAELFDIPYFSPTACGDFRRIYRQALDLNKHVLIEIKTDQQENVELHQSLQDRIKNII
ncbi:MAG: 2-succinyl-5-enolpyruvyl-6-hydroxy-3-cyclohexene-1-carboxylic-acid synthase [Calditrichia bacterium]